MGKTIDKDDAVVVNDAMIQFHPADKFATVPDGAALLASTERGKLDTAVDTLTGGGGKTETVPDAAALIASTALGKLDTAVNTLTGGGGQTAVVDPNSIAAIAAAVKQAMSGISITLGGEQLVKGIEFDNRTIN